MSVDITYSKMLDNIIHNGVEVDTRNSKVKRLTGLQAEFISTPLISVRKTAWKSALLEMEWFLSGSSNIKDLDTRVHAWWRPWANADGEIPNNYGKQFRRYNESIDQLTGEIHSIDQVFLLIEQIRNHPYSRRNVITTWHTEDMIDPATTLTNCHSTVIQTFVNPNKTLDLLMYQRSCDMVLGLPHNWIQQFALMLWLAKQVDLVPGKFTWVGGDCHIYGDHISLAHSVAHTSVSDITPNLIYAGSKGDAFKASDFTLDGAYTPVNKESPKMVV